MPSRRNTKSKTSPRVSTGGFGNDRSDFGAEEERPRPPPPARRRVKRQQPQQTVDEFWDKFVTKFPGKVETILPRNGYAQTKVANIPTGVVHSQTTARSYDQARAECEAAVNKIVRECRRVNMKYRDLHFDIDFDLKYRQRDCLDVLYCSGTQENDLGPKSAKRVPDIFTEPSFFTGGATASDVRQGMTMDCWFLSGLTAISNKQTHHLIDRICVARDEKVGVYGFVFHRDGEWIHTIVDDKLYLRAADYDESHKDKIAWLQIDRKDSEEEYKATFQTGSRALYFSQCSDENETWLPLLEKAFAKAHGDYKSIDGGFTGEAIEDLTGGVTTELFATDILDKAQFWRDELLKVNEEFLFGCATGAFDNWEMEDDSDTESKWTVQARKGVVRMHAYSILEAREVKGQRLLRLRNPWGKKEWQGAWSDGSSEWTPEWMHELNYRFADDGIFWISYEDLLRKYQSFDRTRLFGPDWHITQQWTTLDVPYSADYNDTKFNVTIKKKSPVVIVLSQLDDRYFKGLEGQYSFTLHFRLEKEGEGDYIVRSHGNYMMTRSVSTDLELEPGIYSVLMKITARRNLREPTVEQIVRDNCNQRQEKLLQVGLAYDLAHAKGQYKESEAEKKHRVEVQKKKQAAAKKKQVEVILEQRRREFELEKKRKARAKRHAQKDAERAQRRAEQQRAAGQMNQHVTPIGAPGSATIGHDENEAPTTADTKPKRNGTVSHVAAKDMTAEDKIRQFNDDLKNVSINDHAGNNPSDDPLLVTSSLSDGFDSDSVFDASIDTDLDLLAGTSTNDNTSVGRQPPGPPPQHYDEDDEDAEFENDPWNAVCVVGLRVYSKDHEASVVIVRPRKEDENEDTPLDVDDPSKTVTEEKGEVHGEEEGVEACGC